MAPQSAAGIRRRTPEHQRQQPCFAAVQAQEEHREFHHDERNLIEEQNCDANCCAGGRVGAGGMGSRVAVRVMGEGTSGASPQMPPGPRTGLAKRHRRTVHGGGWDRPSRVTRFMGSTKVGLHAVSLATASRHFTLSSMLD